jgi:translation initiation factor 2-alpha kinase 3
MLIILNSSSSGSEAQSTSNVETELGNLQLGIQRRFSKGTMPKPADLRKNASFEGMVLFEDSSPSVQATISRKGQDSNKTAKSMFRSPTEVDSDDSTEDIERADTGSGSSDDVHIFIKMSVHPMTLEDYVWPDQQKLSDRPLIQHCFHSCASAHILLAILDGVEYIHSHRIVHRDLKPSNIFLSVYQGPVYPEGSIDVSNCPECGSDSRNKGIYIIPHIGDFGLIAELKESKESTSSSPEVGPKFEPSPLAVIASRQPGTKFYCPPIVSRSQSIICPKLDVFSLGVITFEMITKFNTKSERAAVLDNLNRGIFPSDFDKHEMAAGVQGMVCTYREERWDCIRMREWLRGVRAKYEQGAGGL